MIVFEKTVEGVSRAGLERFAQDAQKLAGVRGDVGVLIADNRRLRQLNRNFRGKDHPTDVLSFPRNEGGDIAISADIACANAERLGHRASAEFRVLILHGMLHLAGYDHESDNGAMEKLEARLRAHLKLPASLIERTLISRPQAARSKTARAKATRTQATRNAGSTRARSNPARTAAGTKRRKPR